MQLLSAALRSHLVPILSNLAPCCTTSLTKLKATQLSDQGDVKKEVESHRGQTKQCMGASAKRGNNKNFFEITHLVRGTGSNLVQYSYRDRAQPISSLPRSISIALLKGP